MVGERVCWLLEGALLCESCISTQTSLAIGMNRRFGECASYVWKNDTGIAGLRIQISQATVQNSPSRFCVQVPSRRPNSPPLPPASYESFSTPHRCNTNAQISPLTLSASFRHVVCPPFGIKLSSCATSSRSTRILDPTARTSSDCATMRRYIRSSSETSADQSWVVRESSSSSCVELGSGRTMRSWRRPKSECGSVARVLGGSRWRELGVGLVGSIARSGRERVYDAEILYGH